MRFALLLPLVSLLAACASPRDGAFPSLAMRPAERVTGTVEPAPPPPRPEVVPPATGSRLETLAGQAREAHRRFEAEQGRAAALVAAAGGAAVASESWSVALVALASLDSARSEAMIALADLDSLLIQAAIDAVATAGSAELDAVAATRADVSGLIAEEDAVLARLYRRLRS